MTKNKEIQALSNKISDYKKKYYQNRLIKGLLIGLLFILSTFVFFNFLEFFGRFGTTFRALLFFAFILVSAFTLFSYILKPIYALLNLNQSISDLKAAEDIGRFFPNIKDKLLNTLQLASASSLQNSQLLEASISQKSKELKFIHFADAINLNENKKYLRYLLPLLMMLFLTWSLWPKVYNSTERIVNFKRNFVEPAPFQFRISNANLNAIKNENFSLKLKLLGKSIPSEVFLVLNDRKYKMSNQGSRDFQYDFVKLQEEPTFYFEASGFKSDQYKINLNARPSLLSLKLNLKYPEYIHKPNESFENLGNLIVPAGTQVEWQFKTEQTDSLSLTFNEKEKYQLTKGFISDFSFKKLIKQPSNYEINLQNKISKNLDKIAYYINVIPDQHPQIKLDQLKDTKMFNFIAMGGSISDDYGLTVFKLFYRKRNIKAPYQSINIPINTNTLTQSFYYQMNLESLGIHKNDELEYFLQITDNDAVNGPKSTRTTLQNFAMPSDKAFDKELNKQVEKTENKFEELLKKSKEYKKSLENLDQTLKRKKDVDFQDKKDIEEVLKKKEDLNKELNELKQQLEDLKNQQNRFDKQSSEVNKKMEMLQKLIDEMLKSEDNQLLEQLKKALEQENDTKSLEKLDDFKKNERNLDKNIDRTLNLFKNLQLKQKVEETAKELEKLAEKQNDLADKTLKNESKPEDLKKQQEQLNKEFQDKKEKLKDIEKLSKELKKEMDTKPEDQKEIGEDQKNAEENLSKENKDGASKSQKSAAKKMKKMAKMLQEQMQEGEQKQLDLDMDVLRGILENLIKVSQDQESIMKSFKNISVGDPKFVSLSQRQLKISEDTKVIEDSLYVLAKRVMQIETFVTKEVTDMKNFIDESVQLIKDRKLPQAAAKQQFTMTSMNNLALMLSDTFRQMQSMSAGAGSGKKKQKGMMPSPELGEQQKGLNEKMQGLGKNGKTGKELSQELAKMANEQAKIRKQVKELQDQINGTELGKKIGNNLEELQKQMDKTENDLVNKRINPNLLKRQTEIETRLLEAEKAVKEQELDPRRKSTSGQQFNQKTPPELELFKKEKLKQIELIRTTPPNFTPFYKKITDNYFNKIH